MTLICGALEEHLLTYLLTKRTSLKVRKLPVTYYMAVIVTEYQLRLITGCHIAFKRLVNVYNFCIHVY